MTRVAVAAALILAVCLFGIAASHADEPQRKKFDSPRAVWEAYVAAVRAGKDGEAFDCLTPRAQKLEVSEAVFHSAILGDDPATNPRLKNLRDHGWTDERLAALQPQPESLDAAIEKLIERPREFVVAYKAMFYKAQPGERTALSPALRTAEGPERAQGVAKLRTWHLEGKVRIETEIDKELHFTKLGGGWLIDLPAGP